VFGVLNWISHQTNQRALEVISAYKIDGSTSPLALSTNSDATGLLIEQDNFHYIEAG